MTVYDTLVHSVPGGECVVHGKARPSDPAAVMHASSGQMRKTGRDDSRWYVACTQPHAEARAVVNLQQQNFRVLCPWTHKTVRHARKEARVLAPLFPGYLFVLLSVSHDRWRCVNGTHGVVKLISNRECPIPVPAGVVEELEARLDSEGAINWSPQLTVGQCVRVSGGPFSDLLGTLEKLDARGRVRVMLHLLGRSVVVSLQARDLVPVT